MICLTHRHFILDDDNNPVPCDDLMQWAEWHQQNQARTTIGHHDADGVRVSTIFIGLHTRHVNRPPTLFETMIFGGRWDCYQYRYATYAQALRGHSVTAMCVYNGASQLPKDPGGTDDNSNAN